MKEARQEKGIQILNMREGNPAPDELRRSNTKKPISRKALLMRSEAHTYCISKSVGG
jgi:hypothetical protein